MKFTFVITFALVVLTVSASGQNHAAILLWPDGAPGATGSTDEDNPALIPFLPDASKRNGAAVLVVPGGGFATRAVDHEGVLVAQWFKDHGITAFLLRYRIRPLYSRNEWVMDGQRGIQYIRSHAEAYKISIERVGAIGFSAGANLITDMAFNSLPGKPYATDSLDHFSTKPDFLILAYGFLRMPDSPNPEILKSFPPTFMYGTAEDVSSMKGLTDLYAGLFQAKVPVEAHFFRNGEHGSGFAIGDPVLGVWPNLMHNWLAVGGYLTWKKQIPLAGIVRLDGTPLVRGMVILTAVDDAEAPPVVAYISNTGTGELGRFTVSRDHGPVAGRYRVEVRQEATRWVSNSRDPFMISVLEKQRDNTLTDADIKAWSAFVRKRDLSPSIENQRVFLRKHPKDTKNYVVDIKEGVEIAIDVFSK